MLDQGDRDAENQWHHQTTQIAKKLNPPKLTTVYASKINIRMKSRLNLTVDPRVSHRAKDLARRRGVSLSAMVEQLLADATGRPAKDHRPSFSQRWRGKMQLTKKPEERSTKLFEKYNLSK